MLPEGPSEHKMGSGRLFELEVRLASLVFPQPWKLSKPSEDDQIHPI